MPKIVTPQPMPTTGMPDRVGQNPPTDIDFKNRSGATFGQMSVNPGRPAGDKDGDNDRD